MQEKELDETKAALLACSEAKPTITTDTVFVNKWKTVTKLHTLTDTVTDTLYVPIEGKLGTFIDTLKTDDVDIAYNIAASELSTVTLDYFLKVPKEIIRTETVTKTEIQKITPWRVDGWIGYGFYNKSALVGVNVTTPGVVGFGAFVDAFNKDAGFTMSLRVR